MGCAATPLSARRGETRVPGGQRPRGDRIVVRVPVSSVEGDAVETVAAKVPVESLLPNQVRTRVAARRGRWRGRRDFVSAPNTREAARQRSASRRRSRRVAMEVEAEACRISFGTRTEEDSSHSGAHRRD